MKKLFSDALESIKSLFTKNGRAGNGKDVNENIDNNIKHSAKREESLLRRVWRNIRNLLSRYRAASMCGAALIIVGIIAAVCLSAQSAIKPFDGELPNSSDKSAEVQNATPIPTLVFEPTELTTTEQNACTTAPQDINNMTAQPTEDPASSDIPDAEGSEHTLIRVTSTPEPDVVLRGEHSELIPEVQVKLMNLWYMDQDEPTDYFGSITESALRSFQRRNDLEVTGRLDIETYNQLMSVNARVYMTVLGDEGDDVILVQTRLFELGYLVDYENGVFGQTTEKAVKEFQFSNQLDVDGKVGKMTKEALYSPDAVGKGYAIGDVGDEIRNYQQRLQELGYLTTEPDGIFGKDTQIAVRRFQAQNALIEDGYLGPTTRERLMSSDAVGNALHYGMQGTDVQNIQQRLYELNYLRAKDINGYFTAITEKAVKLFQKNCGIQQDGKVGRYTMSRLFADDAPRSSNPVSSGNSGGNGGSTGGGNGGGTGGGTGGGNGGGTGNNDSDVQARIEKFIRIANNKLGSRYVRGGKGPNVFDCSGFVYWCLTQAGVSQRYMTSHMWANCTRYQRNNSFSNIKRGDVLVFEGHVGISLGNGMMIDASQSKGQVVIRSNQSSYWRSVFICSFRIFR